MLVTENCTVNPTAARAKTGAVRTPKPSAVSAATISPSRRGQLTPAQDAIAAAGPPSSPLEQGRDLARRHRSDQADLAVGVVRGDLEPPGVVVPRVEVDDAARADVLDVLSCLQRLDALA